uniref:Uncharacterized protein n=1 Tax=Anguilla anguilla TaxID=7936 RepID=A0A0E9WH58_ANGAN
MSSCSLTGICCNICFVNSDRVSCPVFASWYAQLCSYSEVTCDICEVTEGFY